MDKYMIVDNRYTSQMPKKWQDRYKVIPSVSCPNVSLPVSAHPDMVLFKTKEKEFICAPEVFSEYEEFLGKYGIRLNKGEKKLNCNYPGDIAYNVLKTGKFAFARFTQTDSTIVEYLDRKNIEKININQGYAKCSVLSIKNVIISADIKLCKKAEACGFECLTIPQGEILLPGYDYGFIGGASGVNTEGEVFFFGDLESASFGKEVYDFLKKRDIKINEIKNLPLTDVGTIMFF